MRKRKLQFRILSWQSHFDSILFRVFLVASSTSFNIQKSRTEKQRGTACSRVYTVVTEDNRESEHLNVNKKRQMEEMIA